MGTENKFQRGDRVVLIYSNPDGNPTLRQGYGGVVCGVNNGSYAVEYDICSEEMHDCNGACRDHHGWYTPEDFLAHEEPQEVDEPFDERDIISFLGIS